MAVELELEPPECSRCGIEMEFTTGGTERSVPLVGTEVEYRQFSCPECGQAARYERVDSSEDWSRAGV